LAAIDSNNWQKLTGAGSEYLHGVEDFVNGKVKPQKAGKVIFDAHFSNPYRNDKKLWYSVGCQIMPSAIGRCGPVVI